MSRFVSFILMGFLLLSVGLGAAHAQSDASRAASLPKYQQECSACHIAYPAGMLPATSWARVMGSLDKHYGTDASLDAASVAEISSWLKPRAGTLRRVSEDPPQDRITKSPWFVRQHNEVSSAVWKRASIGSASNCAACHTGAAKGNFNEDDVRIPK
jgi:mono/diheme cytochrome c family protein